MLQNRKRKMTATYMCCIEVAGDACFVSFGLLDS
jgi:hypothetical protein